jgi:phosphohistidine phosphatase
MSLFLMRHGEALYGGEDILRPLTMHGKKQVEEAAYALKKQEITLSIYASPYVRTQQTARIMASILETAEFSTTHFLIPNASPSLIVDEIHDKEEPILLIAHNPILGRLQHLLIDGRVQERACMLAQIWHLKGPVYASGCMDIVI